MCVILCDSLWRRVVVVWCGVVWCGVFVWRVCGARCVRRLTIDQHTALPPPLKQGNENNKAKNLGLSWPVHPSFVYVFPKIHGLASSKPMALPVPLTPPFNNPQHKTPPQNPPKQTTKGGRTTCWSPCSRGRCWGRRGRASWTRRTRGTRSSTPSPTTVRARVCWFLFAWMDGCVCGWVDR